MMVEIQFNKSSFELRSSVVQSFLNVPIAQSVSMCKIIKLQILKKFKQFRKHILGEFIHEYTYIITVQMFQ